MKVEASIKKAYLENGNGDKWKDVTNSNTQVLDSTEPPFSVQASLPPTSDEVFQASSEDSVTLLLAQVA